MRECFYCNRPMIPRDQWDGSPATRLMIETRDHVFPRSMLRTMPPRPEWWNARNKVRACQGCNETKADTHPEDLLRRLAGPGRDRLRARLSILVGGLEEARREANRLMGG